MTNCVELHYQSTITNDHVPMTKCQRPRASSLLPMTIANSLLSITNCKLPMTKWPTNISISSQFSYELDSIELHSCSYVFMPNYWVLGYSRMFFIHNNATDSWIQLIFCILWMNNVYLLKILLNKPKYFIKQKVLRIFFTPKNTPPKVKNSKMS